MGNNRINIWIVCGLCLVLFGFAIIDSKTSNKYVLKIAYKYYPFLKSNLSCITSESLHPYTQNRTYPQNILNLPIAVHEFFHACMNPRDDWYKNKLLEKFSYNINDSIKVKIDCFDMPKLPESKNILPKRYRELIGEYRVYILLERGTNKSPDDSVNLFYNQYKFFMLFEEFVCQYHAEKMYLNLFKFIQDSIPNPKEKFEAEKLWIASTDGGYDESYLRRYKVILAIYLAHLYENNIEIFRKITRNPDFRKAYTYMMKDDERMIAQMKINKKIVLSRYKGKQKTTSDNFLWQMEQGSKEHSMMIDTVLKLPRLKVIDSMLIKEFLKH